MLSIKLRHQGHRTTFVDPTVDPVIVLEPTECAVLMCLLGLALIQRERPILSLDDVALHELVAHPHMHIPIVRIVELEITAHSMIGISGLADRGCQEIAYAREYFFLVIWIVYAHADPTALHGIKCLIQSSHPIYASTIGQDLHPIMIRPQSTESGDPFHYVAVHQWLTSQDHQLTDIYVSCPQLKIFGVVVPGRPPPEMVVVVAIAIVAGEITHIGDVKFKTVYQYALGHDRDSC